MAWGRVGERSGRDLGWRLERWLEASSSRCPARHGVGGLSAFGGRSEQRAAPRRLLTWHDRFCEKPSRGAPSEPGSSRRGRATGITRLRRDRDVVGRWDTENVSVVCSGPPSTHHGCHVETRLPAPMRGISTSDAGWVSPWTWSKRRTRSGTATIKGFSCVVSQRLTARDEPS